MLSGNDSESEEKDDLQFRLVEPISLPPEVLAQEKDIEAMFQDLVADSRDLRKVREEQVNVGWISVVLLFVLSVVWFWLMYLKSEGH
jgi:hypothetical protein